MKQAAKIGISIGALAVAAGLGVAIYFIVKKVKEGKQQQANTEPEPQKTGVVDVNADKWGWPVYDRAPGAPGNNIATRANNPLDIRSSGEKWQGQMGTTSAGSGFCVFQGVNWGLRAAFKILRTYETKYGLKTLKAKLQKWAPAKENRATYPNEVAAGAGVDVNSMAPYNDLKYWQKVMPYWAKLEGYEGTLTAAQIEEAYNMAFNK